MACSNRRCRNVNPIYVAELEDGRTVCDMCHPATPTEAQWEEWRNVKAKKMQDAETNEEWRQGRDFAAQFKRDNVGL